jgi:sulfite exporter TauE/SafE
MCGPLACGGGHAVGWHVGRLASYALLGAMLGALGLTVLHALPGPGTGSGVLPWVMALGLVMTALDVGRWLQPLPGVRVASAWLMRRSAGLAPSFRSGAIGAVTPYLPCGLVYGMAISALASGSPGRGLMLMVAFGAGSAPALALAQLHLGALKARPRAFELARRAVPLVAAGVLVWRALAASGGESMCR